MAESLIWRCDRFEELDLQTLYQILRLRNQVFVVEQSCVYQDCDGLDSDPQTRHLSGWLNGKLCCYLRLLPSGSEQRATMMGRVVVDPDYRGQGLAHMLVDEGIHLAYKIWPEEKLWANAQQYLQKFYSGHSFVAFGEEEIEDGIPHQMMAHRKTINFEVKQVAFVDQAAKDVAWIREQVFTLEQQIDPLIDLDGLDPDCEHVLIYDGMQPVATGRMQKDGYIGRVAVLRVYRGFGLGRQVIESLINSARQAKLQRVYLGAQCQARDFYFKLGFTVYGEEFIEAGFPHQMMELVL